MSQKTFAWRADPAVYPAPDILRHTIVSVLDTAFDTLGRKYSQNKEGLRFLAFYEVEDSKQTSQLWDTIPAIEKMPTIDTIDALEIVITNVEYQCSPRYARDIPKISPKYSQDIPKIGQSFFSNTPKICPRYAQSMP